MTSAVQRQAAERELASRVLAKRRLLPFVQRINPRYLAGWVHEDIARRLEKFSDDVVNERSPRLMLLLPPRAGKSELSSRMFPAWHLGRNPDHEFISCAYNVGLAMTFSRKVKETISDPNYENVFDARLNPNHQGAEEWSIEGKRGGYIAAGTLGGITGRGCFSLHTTVQSPDGTTLLKDIQVGDLVQAHDFARGTDVFVPVLAIHAQRHAAGTGVYAGVRCTADHPLYSPATQRYHPAADLERQSLPVLRRSEVQQFQGVPGVQPRTASPGVGAAQVPDVWRHEGVPRYCVRRVPPARDQDPGYRADLRALRDVVQPLQGRSGQARASLWAHILQSVVRGGVSCTSQGPRSLRALWHGACGQGPEDLLWQDLLRRASAWFGSRPSVPGPLFAAASAGATARRADLRDDWRGPRAGGAPHQPRSDGQRVGQPDHVVEGGAQAVSRAAGCTAQALAGHIQPTRQEPHVVIDIQTALGNFFADGVLAHNCHILGIDDPIKNAEEADSPDVREKLWDWYGSTAYTRLAPGGGVLLTQTCWNDADLAGKLQQAMAEDPEADQFTIVKYPAIAEADEYLDYDTDLIVYDEVPEHGKLLRMKGEALHPERYDLEKLNRIKRTISPRFWSALYQQNPVPEDGDYFTNDQFRRAQLPDKDKCNVFIAFDFAISEKKQNDYTVGVAGLQDSDDVLHVAEVLRFKSGDAFFIVESILGLCRRWKSPSLVLGVEDGQIWRSIEALLRKRMRETKFYPAIQVLKPITDKMARGRVLQGRMQQGKVSFAALAEWFDVVRSELLRFPAGVHDDIVDALSWMAQLVVGRSAPREVKPKPKASWKDRLKTLGGAGGHMTA